MVTGSLQAKGGSYYVLLNLYDENGKRKVKWKATGLSDKAPKREARLRLMEILDEYNDVGTLESNENVNSNTMGEETERQKGTIPSVPEQDAVPENMDYRACLAFSDYLLWFIGIERTKISRSTYGNYKQMINKRINEYFENVRMYDVTSEMISAFYVDMIEKGLSPNTVLRYNAIISSGCKYAYKHNIIPINIMDKVDAPTAKKFHGAQIYTQEEMKNLLELSKDDPMYLIILLTANYGLRRSEVLGIKWDAIDYKNKKLYIRHKIEVVRIDGVRHSEGSDKMKTEKSRRELPLFPEIEEALKIEWHRQMVNRIVQGKEYSEDDSAYVFVDQKGKLIRPEYVTKHFGILLNNLGLRKIRFHDLRHSCASLLVSKGIDMKVIQEWLGHSNMSTTADIYAHVLFENKRKAGETIQEALLS